MTHLERLQYVTANFHSLKGLRLVALLWSSLTLHVLRSAQVFPSPLQWFVETFGVFFVSLVVFLGMDYYYERRFGRVLAEPRSRDFADFGVLIFLVFSLVLLSQVASWTTVPAPAIGLVSAVWMLLFWWRGKTIRWYWAVLACGALLLGLVQFVSPQLDALLARPQPFGYAIGFVTLFSIGGVLDHLLLVRTLRPQTEVPYGASV